jgi:hypothetical protein
MNSFATRYSISHFATEAVKPTYKHRRLLLPSLSTMAPVLHAIEHLRMGQVTENINISSGMAGNPIAIRHRARDNRARKSESRSERNPMRFERSLNKRTFACELGTNEQPHGMAKSVIRDERGEAWESRQITVSKYARVQPS